MKTIHVAMLNVAMQPPHSIARYTALFKAVFGLRRPIKVWGEYKVLLGSAERHGDAITGQIYKYFDLDKAADWFDISKRQAADKNDIARINIPDSLKPHYQLFDYQFFLEGHRLAYVSRDGAGSLHPRSLKKVLDELLGDTTVKNEYGTVSVTVEPHREKVAQILALPRLKKLKIEVSPPNPDDLDEVEKRVLKRMRKENADKYSVELSSKNPKGLQPDDAHVALARVAQSNGQVIGIGENDAGTVVTLSTRDEPMIEPVRFDPKAELRTAALQRKGEEMLDKVRGN